MFQFRLFILVISTSRSRLPHGSAREESWDMCPLSKSLGHIANFTILFDDLAHCNPPRVHSKGKFHVGIQLGPSRGGVKGN